MGLNFLRAANRKSLKANTKYANREIIEISVAVFKFQMRKRWITSNWCILLGDRRLIRCEKPALNRRLHVTRAKLQYFYQSKRHLLWKIIYYYYYYNYSLFVFISFRISIILYFYNFYNWVIRNQSVALSCALDMCAHIENYF